MGRSGCGTSKDGVWNMNDYSLNAFRLWLETKNGPFVYVDNENCAFAQFLKHQTPGLRVGVGSDVWYNKDATPMIDNPMDKDIAISLIEYTREKICNSQYTFEELRSRMNIKYGVLADA